MSAQATRLSRPGRFWRSLSAAAVIALLLIASAYGNDDDFPVGPMVQFAFSVPPAGEIRSHWLEADTTTGAHIKLSMSALGAGLKRAEVEGQMGRFVRDPSLLQGIADAQRRLHPGQPAFSRLYVIMKVTKLDHGRPAGDTVQTVVTWNVR
ncbi:hypothetical protein [Actinoallomurus sp. CA-150999]|uniref:hypothetical protein n=1 Tax=Actinoallomurus sp. CA-150999 TaxID=3239887 RepID=UPI003D9351E3